MLTAELTQLAPETMQPALFSVWLKGIRRNDGPALADEVMKPFGPRESAEV